MRIWKAYEDLLQGSFRKILAQVSHGIGSHYTDVIICSRVLDSISSDFFGHVVHKFVSDL